MKKNDKMIEAIKKQIAEMKEYELCELRARLVMKSLLEMCGIKYGP